MQDVVIEDFALKTIPHQLSMLLIVVGEVELSGELLGEVVSPEVESATDVEDSSFSGCVALYLVVEITELLLFLLVLVAFSFDIVEGDFVDARLEDWNYMRR